jgi:hypothetical protein
VTRPRSTRPFHRPMANIRSLLVLCRAGTRLAPDGCQRGRLTVDVGRLSSSFRTHRTDGVPGLHGSTRSAGKRAITLPAPDKSTAFPVFMARRAARENVPSIRPLPDEPTAFPPVMVRRTARDNVPSPKPAPDGAPHGRERRGLPTPRAADPAGAGGSWARVGAANCGVLESSPRPAASWPSSCPFHRSTANYNYPKKRDHKKRNTL